MPSEVEDIINAFGIALVRDSKESLKDNKVTFGGGGESHLSAKTKFTVTTTSTGVKLNLMMPKEWYWVEHGRDKGNVSKEGKASIADWATRKAIVGKFQASNLADRKKAQEGHKRKIKALKKLPFDKALKALTFLIARKIASKGFPATHFLTEVIKDGRLKQFEADISAAMKRKIIIEISE